MNLPLLGILRRLDGFPTNYTLLEIRRKKINGLVLSHKYCSYRVFDYAPFCLEVISFPQK
jgi:hypothetical protein